MRVDQFFLVFQQKHEKQAKEYIKAKNKSKAKQRINTVFSRLPQSSLFPSPAFSILEATHSLMLSPTNLTLKLHYCPLMPLHITPILSPLLYVSAAQYIINVIYTYIHYAKA